ncbi:NADH:ubiquinone reductase (Na(+)-transporting) subunit F [Marivita geojedonensis]|uniref:Na(+)-translocating NADH-quinone reductase subunit F n=1 Tax=Marivita geojedonensis TaxID=1123756 RepID=A0A1X4NQI4_9RHOB|nr:NADH:ubiquinone reductase (Na(+)-transporting) subunit F [Marivita geojedonensis]OSQ53146.1 NADH-quinone reductase [Marivita geojedonensis]PRY81917.1 Na+-transporting NADH:ubiquinone oxidoreductase subunit F [Marivita geojedonensis]
MTEVLIGSLIIVGLIVGMAVGLLFLQRRLVPSTGLDVQVNETKHVVARRGDKLLGVLHGAGIMIPAACGGSGTCGLCRVTVTGDGAGQPQATERGVLSPRERRAHVRLACQTSLRGDCAVHVSDDILGSGGGFDCTVASTRMLAPLIREIVVNLPEDRSSDFRAGDFMQITAPPYELNFADIEVPPAFRDAWDLSGWRSMASRSDAEVTRAYSLASRPEDTGRAVFNIRLAVPPAGREDAVPPGIVSSWLFSVAKGDDITLSGPFGDFHVQPTNREMVYVGGGVGMAPLRAMIHQELARGSTRRIRYFYGARSAADLFYSEEFTELARRHDKFSWTPALSDPAPGDRWTGATGFIHETLLAEMRAHPAPEECEYYLCGPPVMISAVLATLSRLGVEPASIFYDDFGA